MKKLAKKNLDLGSEMKKTMKWAIYRIHMKNYEEILGTTLRREWCYNIARIAKLIFIFIFIFF